jgi:hypothetical protein
MPIYKDYSDGEKSGTLIIDSENGELIRDERDVKPDPDEAYERSKEEER